MKRPCYVPSKNYKVRVTAKNKVLNKLHITTIVSISSRVIAARRASRGPRRVALIGRSPFRVFFALSHRRLSRLLHMPQGFAAVLLAAASVLPAFFFFSPRFLVLRTFPLSPSFCLHAMQAVQFFTSVGKQV